MENSPFRQCPIYKKCSGCQLQNMDYKSQLKWKQGLVCRLLSPFCRVSPIIGMERPVHYRNKAQAVVRTAKGGKIVSGVYQSKTNGVVSTDTCMLNTEKANEIIAAVRVLLKSFKLRPYNPFDGSGFLKHVLVRQGFQSGEIMVVLVAGTMTFPAKNNFVKALLKVHPDISTIVLNCNDHPYKMMLGTAEKTLYGRGYITDTLCGKTFKISPRSFYQVNPVQTEILYRKAVEMARLNGKETVIDAYCGVGTIGIYCSAFAKQVIGVERNLDAMRDAIENAKRNKIKNIYFHCRDAGEFMRELANSGEQIDVVFTDPPRSGCSMEFLNALATLCPARIVYISCNPQTQQRDLRFLTQKGYEVKEIQPVDMFPHTNHVETVVLLSKGEINSKKVRVEFSLEDMDMSGFQNDATYGQIKERVLQQTGLKVSSLYIAQVKQKYGIIERENYNKPKSENAKQPKCPPEKEAAITEALKFFGMI